MDILSANGRTTARKSQRDRELKVFGDFPARTPLLILNEIATFAVSDNGEYIAIVPKQSIVSLRHVKPSVYVYQWSDDGWHEEAMFHPLPFRVRSLCWNEVHEMPELLLTLVDESMWRFYSWSRGWIFENIWCPKQHS